MGNLISIPAPVANSSWTNIKIYHSTTETGTYTLLTTLTLTVSAPVTVYYDETGLSTDWYYYTYYDSVGPVTSAASEKFQAQAFTTTYTQPHRIAEYLQVKNSQGVHQYDGQTTPSIFEIISLIKQAEDKIDKATSHAWRMRYSGTETGNATEANYVYYDAPDVIDLREGGKIYLHHRKIRPQTVTQIDDCEATTGWTASGTNSVATSTAQKTKGTYSIALVKSDTSSATCSMSKTTTSVDFTNRTFVASVYISSTLYANLNATSTALEIRFGSDSSNYYSKTYTKAQLTSGWNTLYFTTLTSTATSSPDVTAIDYTYISYITAATSTTAATDNFMVDNILTNDGDALEVWDGNQYVDYMTTKTEGRGNDYWMDYDKGVLTLYDVFTNINQAIRMKYRYGDTSVPSDIERAATLIVAQDAILSDDRSVMLPQGGDAVTLSNKLERIEKEVKEILNNRGEVRFLKRS